MDDGFCCSEGKVSVNLTNRMNVKEGRLADSSDVGLEGQGIIRDYAKVAC